MSIGAAINAGFRAPLPDGEVTPLQFLTPDGQRVMPEGAEEYAAYLETVDTELLLRFYRDMVRARTLDSIGTNLQRQGQLALWPPSHGQEGCQVGAARAAKTQDHIFPSYREHVVGMIRGVDPLGYMSVFRGISHGGWNPLDPNNGNFRPYTLVIGSQTLHAAGFAMGQRFDGAIATGQPERDEATMVFFGDGSTSQGDVNEAFIFATSYQSPLVFFLQNNHYAISVPVRRQSRTPLYLRAAGFGMPSIQIDGNDVLAAFAATAKHLDDARAGRGPACIEALTYRVGAHTTSDDPSKYRADAEREAWVAKDPIVRLERYLRTLDVADAVFAEIQSEMDAFGSDLRTRTLQLGSPPAGDMFAHVYSEPHPLMEQQAEWLERYEASMTALAASEGSV